MKIQYELLRRDDACDVYTTVSVHPSLSEAFDSAGFSNADLWKRTSSATAAPWTPALSTSLSPPLVVEVQLAENDRERIELALRLAFLYGQSAGEHQKAWVIDQMARVLAGDEDYCIRRADYCAGDDGPETYEWDEGVAP